MMRLWVDSYAKTSPVFTSATLSVVAHSVVIAAWVVATLPSPGGPAPCSGRGEGYGAQI